MILYRKIPIKYVTRCAGIENSCSIFKKYQYYRGILVRQKAPAESKDAQFSIFTSLKSCVGSIRPTNSITSCLGVYIYIYGWVEKALI